MKIKTFGFPVFEEWVRRGNEVRLELGAYRCDVRAFSWGDNGALYMFATSLADRNPLNIYTPQIFCRRFEYNGDNEKLKQWYETTVLEFNTFWEKHVKATYLDEE